LSIDVIERRRVVEERLRRARNLAQALERATDDITSRSGQTIEDLDPESSLRTAVSTLAGVAALRPGFDVLVALPDSPFSLRLRHLADDVDITLVRNPAGGADGTEPSAPNAVPEPRKLSAPPELSHQADAPEPPEDADSGGHVASDLAAMLWQDVGPPPP
jgi:hypothetical protein